MKNKLNLRFATPNDISIVFQFILELSRFEQLEHEVIGTQEKLRESLFGKQPECEVILAFLDEKPVGFALFFHNYSTFLTRKGLYLEDLYVTPEARGSGVGKALLQYLAKITIDRNCGRMEWWVLDWNTKAIDFYKQLKAEPMDEWTVFRLTGKNLEDLAQQPSSE